MASPASYHLLQFSIGSNPQDPRRVEPDISAGCKSWLDVGCGAGAMLQVGSTSGVPAIGVDPDLKALRLGRSMHVSAPLLCCVGEQLPFATASFDLVTSRVALPYMKIQAAAHEFARVLQQGGRVWLALHPLSRFSWRQACGSPLHFAYEIYRMSNTLAFHWGLPQFRCPEPRRRCESYQTDRGITRALQRAGFGAIQIARQPHYVVTAVRN